MAKQIPQRHLKDEERSLPVTYQLHYFNEIKGGDKITPALIKENDQLLESSGVLTLQKEKLEPTTRSMSNREFNDKVSNFIARFNATHLHDNINMTSQLQDKSYANKHKETMPRGGDHNALNQHKRFSSSLVSAILFLGILYHIYSFFCQSPMIPIHGRVAIWSSLLNLFGFIMFVCAVVKMVLVQASFTHTQRAMLVFWGILMHARSATTFSEMYVPILGVFLMGWLACAKTTI